MSNSALATLTAQYTDSENEDNNISPETDNSQSSQSVIPKVRITSQASPEHNTQNGSDINIEKNKKVSKNRSSKRTVKRLVSYRDDTIVTDDEQNDDYDSSGDDDDDDENDANNTQDDISQAAIADYMDINSKRNDKDDHNKNDTNSDFIEELPKLQKDSSVNDNAVGTEDKKYAKYTHYGFSLPPEPSGKPLPELTEKIRQLYDKMENSNMDMNSLIQQRKDFRNPSIYEKLIQFCDINEFGTNYPPEIYDPLRWGPESYYEELDRAQCAEMAKRQKERKDKDKIEQVSALARKVEKEAKKRKSKWDQPASSKQSLPAALTTTVTGTKGTVISAFGSLPKKPA